MVFFFWIKIWAEFRQYFCSIQYFCWGQSLSCILWYLGWTRKIQKGFMCFAPLYFYSWTFFFMWQKWASSRPSQDIQDFSYGISFPNDNITRSEGRHCRPNTQLQKVYIITSGIFYWPKQLMSPYGLLQEGIKFHIGWEHLEQL